MSPCLQAFSERRGQVWTQRIHRRDASCSEETDVQPEEELQSLFRESDPGKHHMGRLIFTLKGQRLRCLWKHKWDKMRWDDWMLTMIGSLCVQVKKAVGGSSRGMALYDDDVRTSQMFLTGYDSESSFSADTPVSFWPQSTGCDRSSFKFLFVVNKEKLNASALTYTHRAKHDGNLFSVTTALRLPQWNMMNLSSAPPGGSQAASIRFYYFNRRSRSSSVSYTGATVFCPTRSGSPKCKK